MSGFVRGAVRSRRGGVHTLAGVVVLAAAVTGCSGGAPTGGGATGTPPSGAPAGSGATVSEADAPTPPPATLTVGGASSLTDVFTDIAEQFTDATGIPVRLTFAGSSSLAEQMRAGAPIDVFASAGAAVMTPLAVERLVTDVTDFASNSMVIAVPTGNPAGVNGPADLARVSLVVCAAQVPCGAAAAEVIERGGLDVRPVSYEPDSRSVLMKIRTDEADAGLVYVTDVAAAADEVQGVPIPAEANATTDYQAAVAAESDNPEAATQFVRFLAEPRAQAVLADAGFGPPR